MAHPLTFRRPLADLGVISLRAFSLHVLTLHWHEGWLFLKEKATPLRGFCKHQK
jgi:hypothetical protein